jgi:hypothetical protein
MAEEQIKKYRRPVNIKNDTYQKNGNTVQDNLTQEDIELLLEEYEQIASFDELKEGMHIRYYTTIKKKQVFRMGGTIIKLDLDKNFAVVTNGHVNWSVQLNSNTIIYRKMTTEEVKQFYENELDNKEMELKKCRSNIEKLKNGYKQIQAENEQLHIDNKQLRSELLQIKKLIKKTGII